MTCGEARGWCVTVYSSITVLLHLFLIFNIHAFIGLNKNIYHVIVEILYFSVTCKVSSSAKVTTLFKILLKQNIPLPGAGPQNFEWGDAVLTSKRVGPKMGVNILSPLKGTKFWRFEGGFFRRSSSKQNEEQKRL